MAKITKNAAVFTEEEFLERGGSPVMLDLSKLTERRVRKAINSVYQLTDDAATALAIHSSATMAAVMDHYAFVCTLHGEMMDPAKFVKTLSEAMLDDLEGTKAYMEEKEENGKTRFENTKNREGKA